MRQRASLILVVVVLALSRLPWSTSLPGEYVYDDRPFVSEKPQLRSGSLLSLFGEDFLAPHRKSGLYRPVTSVSYALVWRSGLEDAVWQRTANLLLDLVAGVLLLAVLVRLGVSPPVSLLAVLIFLTHPLHGEAVGLCSGRSELLAAGLVLASLLLLPWGGRRYRIRDHVGSLVLFVLACLSKESAFVAPALFAVILFRERSSSSRLWLIGPFVAAAVLIALLRWSVVGNIPLPGFQVENPVATSSLGERLPVAAALLGRHALLALFPIHLRADYSAHELPLPRGWLDPLALLGVGLCVVVVALVARARGNSSTQVARMGGALFLFFLVPVLNLVPIGTIFAERHGYLPSAGGAILLAGVVEGLSPAWRRGALLPLVLIITAFSVRTGLRGPDLATEDAFYSVLVEDAPRSAKARWLRANYLLAAGRLAEARELAEEALGIEPRFPEALYGLAFIDYEAGDLAEARIRALECIDREPLHAGAHALLGNVAFRTGDFARAAEWYEKALALDPDLKGVRQNLEEARARR